MALYLTPRQVVQDFDLVALIKDSRDQRVGQIARVGSISSDCSRAIVLVHLIFPEGNHGTWTVPGSLPRIERTVFPVDPPLLFYRHPLTQMSSALHLAIRGERCSLPDFHRIYKGLHNGNGDGYLHESWKQLFDVEFPLK